MLSPRPAFSISLLAGIAVVALSALGIARGTPSVCGGLDRKYPPIIAFELARSVEDLHAIFGGEEGTCRDAVREQLDRTNRIDSLVFIPVYGTFLVFFLLGMRNLNRKMANFGVIIAFIACLADWLENLCLFRLSANPDVASSFLSVLMISTELKWIALGVVGVIGGLLIRKRGGIVAHAGAVLCFPGILATLATVPAPASVGPYMATTIALGWIVFLVVAVVGVSEARA